MHSHVCTMLLVPQNRHEQMTQIQHGTHRTLVYMLWSAKPECAAAKGNTAHCKTLRKQLSRRAAAATEQGSKPSQGMWAYQRQVLELRQLICVGPRLKVDSSSCPARAEQEHQQVMSPGCNDFICKLATDGSRCLLNRHSDRPCSFQGPALQQQLEPRSPEWACRMPKFLDEQETSCTLDF